MEAPPADAVTFSCSSKKHPRKSTGRRRSFTDSWLDIVFGFHPLSAQQLARIVDTPLEEFVDIQCSASFVEDVKETHGAMAVTIRSIKADDDAPDTSKRFKLKTRHTVASMKENFPRGLVDALGVEQMMFFVEVPSDAGLILRILNVGGSAPEPPEGYEEAGSLTDQLIHLLGGQVTHMVNKLEAAEPDLGLWRAKVRELEKDGLNRTVFKCLADDSVLMVLGCLLWDRTGGRAQNSRAGGPGGAGGTGADAGTCYRGVMDWSEDESELSEEESETSEDDSPSSDDEGKGNEEASEGSKDE